MSFDLSGSVSLGQKNNRDRRLIIAFFVFAIILGTSLLVYDNLILRNAKVTEIKRNEYGKGKRRVSLDVSIGGEKREEYDISVNERGYTNEEILSVIKEGVGEIEKLILGENSGFDKITDDLNLIEEFPNKPISVAWESSNREIISLSGKVNTKGIGKDGEEVELVATLSSIENENVKARHSIIVRVFDKASGKEKEKEKVMEAIAGVDEESEDMGKLELPSEILGSEVSFYKQENLRGLYLILMAVLVGVLLVIRNRQKVEVYEEERKKQMLRDYPDIISTIYLLLESNMTMSRAFEKIGTDYEKTRKGSNIRYAYEEILVTLREIKSKKSESECYESFGKRANIREYIKLGALLSNNLRKGSRGLSVLLKNEVSEALYERKARAKRQSEEAGTKLLLPMFLMLSVVMIIVIVPAFLSINI